MSGGNPKCLYCLTVMIVLLGAALSQEEIELSTSCSDPLNVNNSCITLNEVLGNIFSNTTLLLERGIHIIRNHSQVLSISDLRIVGKTTNRDDVIIECDPTFGLIFMDIQRLSFENLMIRDCGFNGTKRVNNTFRYVQNFIFLFYEPLPDFSTGLFLAQITDLNIENVVFDRNEGFGVVGINIIGNSRISNVEFSRNRPKKCVLEVEQNFNPGGSGGGMFLLYQDYTSNFSGSINETSFITIDNMLVYENYNCRIDLFSVQHNLLSRSLEPGLIEDASFIGAGGVTIALAQRSYKVSANVTDSLFRNNFGSFHGSAFEVSQYELTSDSHVTVTNTNFSDNGLLENLDGPLQYYDNTRDASNPGGALVVAFYLPLPSISAYSTELLSDIIAQTESSVLVSKCYFYGNRAESGSGIQIFSFGPTISSIQDRMTIQHCHFQNNSGDYGSAVFVTEISYSAFEPGLRVTFDSITVVENKRNSEVSIRSTTSGVMNINFINVTLTGENCFYLNQDSAISIYSGILVISGYANFTENVGVNGGALNLDTESYLVLAGDNTSILFHRNTARIYGGGIYTNLDPIRENNYDCFLFFDDVDIFCNVRGSCPMPNGRFSLTFDSNVAEFGQAIYGSSFANCPWNTNSNGIAHLTLGDNISNVPRGMLPIIFEPAFYSSTTIVNTVAKRIIPNYNNSILNRDNTVHLYPGQPFLFSLGSFDSLNQSVPLTILSQLQIVSENDLAHSQIGASNRFLLAGGSSEYTDVSFIVLATENSSYQMTINSDEEFVESFVVEVILQFCPGGFRFDNISHACVCNVTDLEEVMCNENGTLTYRVDYWLGLSNRSGHIQEQCIFDYCIPGRSILDLSEPDSQCRDNRSGILCGGCAKGFSRMIGTSACGICDSYAYLLWIILFALLGIGLFAYLGIWNVTITDGFINAFIFYANISNVYLTSFTPNLPGDGRTIPQVVIAWLNLDFGIPICFFPGMTTLDLAGLRFIFPLYLLMLLLTFMYCAKYISNQKVAHFCQKINVTHVFATMILLCYTSLIRTCFSILGSIYIDSELRWTIDPNVVYSNPLHAFLAGFSAILLVFLIPFPLLLLFPGFIYRSSFLKYSKPLIDAFIAPLAPGRAFWVGMRMIFRIVFLLTSFFPDNSVVIALSILITILTVFETNLQPFNSFAKNIVNRTLMINLTIYSITAIYSNLQSLLTPGMERTFNTVNLYLFLLLFIFLNLYYLIIRFQCSQRPYEKIIAFILKKIGILRAKFSSSKEESKHSKIKKDNNRGNVVLTHTSVSINLTRDSDFEETDFIAYREELLDDPALTSSDPEPRGKKVVTVDSTS